MVGINLSNVERKKFQLSSFVVMIVINLFFSKKF